MIQEYLLLNEAEKDSISAFDAKESIMKLSQIKEQNEWFVSFYLKGEKEETAKKLSEIDTSFRAQFTVITLENGSSAYMNSKLFPLISDFERKLRKLLYITSAIHKNDTSVSNISNLESKDFGTIFTMLFIDDIFLSNIKDSIKNRPKEQFSKADIISYIESLDENTVWDKLLGKDAVPSLRTKFNDVRELRNDVMHSHYIDWKRYKDAEKLYTKINEELDSSLAAVISPSDPVKEDSSFNQTLQDVLKTHDNDLSISELQKQLQEITNIGRISTESIALQQQLREIAQIDKLSPDIAKIQEEWKDISKSLVPTESFRSIKEAIKSINSITADIRPTLAELKKISQIDLPKIEIPTELIKKQEISPSIPAVSNTYEDTHQANETGHSSNNGGKQ